MKVMKDAFEVMDNIGNKKVYQLQEMGPKRNSKNALSTDANNQTVGVGDAVRIVDGPHKVSI